MKILLRKDVATFTKLIWIGDNIANADRTVGITHYENALIDRVFLTRSILETDYAGRSEKTRPDECHCQSGRQSGVLQNPSSSPFAKGEINARFRVSLRLHGMTKKILRHNLPFAPLCRFPPVYPGYNLFPHKFSYSFSSASLASSFDWKICGAMFRLLSSLPSFMRKKALVVYLVTSV
jgi:hypothetical protein